MDLRVLIAPPRHPCAHAVAIPANPSVEESRNVPALRAVIFSFLVRRAQAALGSTHKKRKTPLWGALLNSLS